VDLVDAEQEVTVYLVIPGAHPLLCPVCQKTAPRYDFRCRRWRHLDTCQYRTILLAQVPRINCPEHGVLQIPVPWAEENSRFTALFECLVIDWLKESSLSAVARKLRLSWDEVDGIMARAVERGLERRKLEPPEAIGVDETSFKKRHQYVTVVSDIIRSRVIHVEDGREKASLDRFYETLSVEEKKGIEIVAMDMSAAYIESTREHVPEADKKIAFDKFHVAQHLGEAVDDVRKEEHRELMAEGNEILKGTKYSWLKNPKNFTMETWKEFEALRNSSLKVARAWAIKETGMGLWHYVQRGRAEKAWKRFIGWALRSRLQPIIEKARMIKNHLTGILNAVVSGATNALAESLNSIVQTIKSKARGFRNRERFRNAIYFHLGGLDLYPRPVLTHTDS
jgi:transposase